MDYEGKFVQVPLTIRELVEIKVISKGEAWAYSSLFSLCYIRREAYSQSIELPALRKMWAVDNKQVKNILDKLAETKLITYKTTGQTIYFDCLLRHKNQNAWRDSSGHFEDDGGSCFEEAI